MRESYIGRGIEILGVITGAFGGFLIGITPPDGSGVKFAIGFSSFGGLFLILLAIVLGEWRKIPTIAWLSSAIIMFLLFLFCGMVYWEKLQLLTFPYPQADGTTTRAVRGLEFQQNELEELKKYDDNITEFVKESGGLDERNSIWTEESLREARRTLLLWYTVTFFCAVAMLEHI